MPELPEIEVIRRDLEKEVVGRRIKDVEVRNTKHAMKAVRRHGRRKELQDLLEGTKVEKILRRGRKLLFALDNEHVLAVDLGEAGSLLKTSSSDDIESHTHVVFGWTIGGQLRFVDPTLEGELFVVPASALEEDKEFATTALDPLDNTQPLTWVQFSGLLEQKSVSLKELLLDETIILGLGDVYSDEVLFAAALRFDRSSDKLSSQDVRRLYRALTETLHEAVKARGTSRGSDAFRDLHGDEGTFQAELKVYGREGEPCRRCRNTIERAEHNGRSTYFCPQCQA